MKQWGLSMDELVKLGSIYLADLMKKQPELASLENATTELLFIVARLIRDNNQRIAEQLNQCLGSQPLVDVLPPIDADAQVVISGVSVKRSTSGMSFIFGEVRNVAGHRLPEVEIIAALYDERDCVVDRGTDVVYDLAADGKYVFKVTFFETAPFVRYEVTAVIEPV